jgi:hypothetical protein
MVNPMTKCPSCGKGTLRKTEIEESMFGVSLGKFPGEACGLCKETFLDESAMADLEQRAKKAGIWGLGKKLKVVRSGNSLVIRIQVELAEHMHLKPGTEVYVHPEGESRIVVDVGG